MLDRYSLRWRVPAIIAGILVAAVATLSILAYGAAKRSAIQASQERLQNAADRVAGLSGDAVANLIRLADTAAANPAVIEALRNPGQPLTPAAIAALKRVRPDTLQITVALLDMQGRPIEGVTPELAPERPAERLAPIEKPTVHPFRVDRGVMEFIVAVPVRDSGKVIGQLAQWRRVNRVTTSMRVISDLIGAHALLAIGNADGSFVTEFDDTLHAPVIRDSARSRQARTEHVTAVANIPGTPWAWRVEYPSAIVLAPLKVLSWQSLLLAFVVVGFAIAAGVVISQRMTRSLAELTTTAEMIAGGDLTRRPRTDGRRDEVGRLATSFSTMADSIRDSHDLLERRIEERTADLHNAMQQLQDTQDELVRKERLATIGQLASSVGHELRNPLGVMSNAVYILERTLGEQPPKAQNYLRLLSAQIKLSERIVGGLLDSTRSPSPQVKSVEVHSLVDEHLQRVTVPPHVQVELAINPNLPKVNVDPDQVGQILVNLFTNATQAMETKPGVMRVHAHNGDGRVHIEVQDSGPGVPPELVDKIFEPLYTTKARGIGLGLSVSRSLATANRGTLTVVNHPDGGAVFTLDLPTGDTQ